MFFNKSREKIKKIVSKVYRDDKVFPQIIPALTDLKSTIELVSADMGTWATNNILLIREDKIPKARLEEIQQPGY